MRTSQRTTMRKALRSSQRGEKPPIDVVDVIEVIGAPWQKNSLGMGRRDGF